MFVIGRPRRKINPIRWMPRHVGWAKASPCPSRMVMNVMPGDGAGVPNMLWLLSVTVDRAMMGTLSL